MKGSSPRPAPPRTASLPPPPALHPRNRHQGRYDLPALCAANPALKRHLVRTPAGTDSIDFAKPDAVRELNRALLKHHYGIAHWTIPDGYLCPPVPGRVDYLHGMADLLAESHGGTVPRGTQVRLLDIGTGANLIYPLLAQAEYGWYCVGSDIEAASLQSAAAIVQANALHTQIELRQQAHRGQIFAGVIAAGERFALTVCNPPFHSSAKEAAQGSQRKVRNLSGGKAAASRGAPALNFGGQANELWCTGGEASFLRRMVKESASFAQQVLWFSSLVAKREHLPELHKQLAKAGAAAVREVDMAQGNKRSRFVAWSFMPPAAHAAWFTAHSGA